MLWRIVHPKVSPGTVVRAETAEVAIATMREMPTCPIDEIEAVPLTLEFMEKLMNDRVLAMFIAMKHK